MTRPRVPAGVWLVLALSLIAAWWPLLDARVRDAARHSTELPRAEAWAELAAALPEGRDPDAPLHVHALRSAEFVWLRLLAYPQRLEALPRGLDADDLRRVLPPDDAWLLMLHAGEPERVLRALGERVAPRTPVLRGRSDAHLLLELAP